jgi:arsenate reductase (thioredoxin)
MVEPTRFLRNGLLDLMRKEAVWPKPVIFRLAFGYFFVVTLHQNITARMNANILDAIRMFSDQNISPERKVVLQPLIAFIQAQRAEGTAIDLHFICTHNSRRSHLAQIWAQAMAHHLGIEGVVCYSGGTEATAMFPKVAETLEKQGFEILKLSEGTNPVYAVKYDENAPAVVCFSKKYDHPFNPSKGFGAVLTCNSADEACPVVFGSKARIPVKYDDPKAFDGTDLMDTKYAERSLEIGQEMFFVFKTTAESRSANNLG